MICLAAVTLTGAIGVLHQLQERNRSGLGLTVSAELAEHSTNKCVVRFRIRNQSTIPLEIDNHHVPWFLEADNVHVAVLLSNNGWREREQPLPRRSYAPIDAPVGFLTLAVGSSIVGDCNLEVFYPDLVSALNRTDAALLWTYEPPPTGPLKWQAAISGYVRIPQLKQSRSR